MEKMFNRIDSLTRAGRGNLPSRLLTPQAFMQLTADEVERANRYDRPLSVALLLIDGLQMIRKQHGTVVSEDVFADVTARVIRELRSPDRTGRIGNGQLGVLLPESGPKQAETAMNRVREMIADIVIKTPAGPQTVSLSIGVASLSPRTRNPKTFLMSACFELRRAQSQGCNLVCAAPPQTVRLSMPRSGELH